MHVIKTLELKYCNSLTFSCNLPRAEVPMVAARRFFAAGKYYNTSNRILDVLEVKAFLNVVCFVCFMLSATNEIQPEERSRFFLKSRYF